MSDMLSGVTGGLAQSLHSTNRPPAEQRVAGRSFESVLGASPGSSSLAETPSGVSGAQLEKARADLMQRLDRIPAGGNRIGALLPELIDTRTRMGLLKEAMKDVQGSESPNLRGRFSQVETEWYQIEGIMKSDRQLSTGELLGLQARLYQVSQHIEVLSKVVDQVTSGVKTVLNTNV